MANFLKSLFVKGVEIDTAGAITGDVLKYDGSKFEAASAGSISLDGLSDVVITAPATGSTLYFDGTNWIDSTTLIPNVSDTLVGKNTTDTLTNKTLTTPTINGPTITATGQTPVIHGILLPNTHGIYFEGPTTDTNQTFLYCVEPTADRNILLPNADGTIALSGSIALGTDTTGNYMSGISGTSPVSVAHTPAEGSSATVALASGYGDTQNPYASKTANYVLAAPDGINGTPSFRAITSSDITNINANNITSGTLPDARLSFSGTGVSTGDVSIEMGGSRTDSGNCYIDMHAANSTDFESRILRLAGVNGDFSFTNTGTGTMSFEQGNTSPINFKTGSVSRIYVDTSGRVGVNTSSPQASLDVQATTGTAMRITNSGTGESFRVEDATGDITPFVIDASGNVGMGTATPLARLHITDGNANIRLNTSTTFADALNIVPPTSFNSRSITLNTATLTAYRTVTLPDATGTVITTGNLTDFTVTAGTTSTGASGVGYMGLPQNATTTGAYTIVAADAGKHIYSTATRTVTIPSNASVAMPVGSTIVFIAATGATVTIAITTDTMYLAGPGTTGSRTLAAFGMATAVKITSTSWIISGNGLT
jgi:hypothetical protein